MFKKIALAILLLVIALAGGLYYTWANLDRFIKAGVEKYGSEATQADVRLGGVNLSLASGEGALSNFSVGNPKGFSDEKSLSFGSVSVKVDLKSLQGTGPIVIREIRIEKPHVLYEVANDGGNNLQTLAENAKAYAASFSKDDKVKEAEEGKAAEQKAEEPARKILIKDMIISDGDVVIHQQALADVSGGPLSATLPTIHLVDIGKSSGGATAAQVAEQIVGAITNSAVNVASKALAGNVVKSIKDKLDNAVGTEGVDGAVDQIKGLFGE